MRTALTQSVFVYTVVQLICIKTHNLCRTFQDGGCVVVGSGVKVRENIRLQGSEFVIFWIHFF